MLQDSLEDMKIICLFYFKIHGYINLYQVNICISPNDPRPYSIGGFGHLEKTTLCPQVFLAWHFLPYQFTSKWFSCLKNRRFPSPKTELQTVAAKSKPSPGKFQTFSRGMQKWWFRWQIAGFTFHFSDFTFNDFCHTAFRAPGVQD